MMNLLNGEKREIVQTSCCQKSDPPILCCSKAVYAQSMILDILNVCRVLYIFEFLNITAVQYKNTGVTLSQSHMDVPWV